MRRFSAQRSLVSTGVLAIAKRNSNDDDPLVLNSLRDTLEADGHGVTTADGGQAGIDAFLAARAQGNPFPVVITDLGMPYVDGRKVSSAVKTAAPGTIVLLLTGWGQRLVADGDVPPHVTMRSMLETSLMGVIHRLAMPCCFGMAGRLQSGEICGRGCAQAFGELESSRGAVSVPTAPRTANREGDFSALPNG